MTLIAKNPPSQNGEEKKVAPGAKVVTVTQNTPPKKVEAGQELKPLEDRMHRINQLWQLQGKHQRLNESLSRLKKFLAEAEKDNLQIVIKCTDYSNREEFSTKNIAVIEDVLICLIETINVKIKAIEPELVW
jgi:hypothetical protein